LAIRGIGKKRLDKMTKYLIAGQPLAAKPATKSATGRSASTASNEKPSSSAGPAPSTKPAAKSTVSENKPVDGAAKNAADADSDEEPQ
jgi:hypothetical protein